MTPHPLDRRHQDVPARRPRTPAPVIAVDDVDLESRRGRDLRHHRLFRRRQEHRAAARQRARDRHDAARVEIDGRDITRLRERELRALRGDIGMIFQQFNLFESRTVAGNVAYPLEIAGRSSRRDRRARRRAARLRRPVRQGAQLPRAALRRPEAARRHRPRSRDEPPHPPRRRGDQRARPRHDAGGARPAPRVNRELGVTILVITHEMDVIRTLADRVIVMEDGRIIESGDVFDVLSAPQHTATQRFVVEHHRGRPRRRAAADAPRPPSRPHRHLHDPRRRRHAGRRVRGALVARRALRAHPRRHQRHPRARVRAPDPGADRGGRCRRRARSPPHRRFAPLIEEDVRG